MNRKVKALLLSALVLPGLGQLYLGRKVIGALIIVFVNFLIIIGLFVLLRGLSPVIAAQIAGGAISITPSEVLTSLDSSAGFGKFVLIAFCAVWLFSVGDILKSNTTELNIL